MIRVENRCGIGCSTEVGEEREGRGYYMTGQVGQVGNQHGAAVVGDEREVAVAAVERARSEDERA